MQSGIFGTASPRVTDREYRLQVARSDYTQ